VGQTLLLLLDCYFGVKQIKCSIEIARSGKSNMAKQKFPTLGLGNKPITQDQFQTQLQSLLKQQKYRQVLDEIQKTKRAQPDLVFTPAESEIWLLRGKQEFQKKDFQS
jgi:hypothetical protein